MITLISSKKLADLRKRLDAADEVILYMVMTHCQSGHGYDSGGLTANSEALRWLEYEGYLDYVGTPTGRQVACIDRRIRRTV